ncbi:hypothetical protein F2Q69_00015573 [Brassica cretica]|uniref:Uncharacterized protein n=1 Tax=Brassica cretica TaxID=69181 RepID=A0A8S9R4B6_BRACR|nr:hypothetical protein F2Q69_00015573 [Brassica cretica]
MDFKRDVLLIQQAKNLEERLSEVEDITIFPKPVIRRELWKDREINSANNLQTENIQPRQLPHDLRHPEDTFNVPEEPYIILPYTSKHWNKRIFISGNLPFPDSFVLGGVKDQRLFSFQPEDTKINMSLLNNHRLLFLGYKTKISRYKIRPSKWLQISLTASSLKTKTISFIFMYFLSLLEY